MSYVFCLFTPLYWRFRLSRVSQSIDLDEIYRLVSKILNFTPCGSVLGRFCVFTVKIDFLKSNLLSNRAVERFWDALWLGIRPFLCFCLVRGSCARVLCASLVHRLVRQKQIILPNTVSQPHLQEEQEQNKQTSEQEK